MVFYYVLITLYAHETRRDHLLRTVNTANICMGKQERCQDTEIWLATIVQHMSAFLKSLSGKPVCICVCLCVSRVCMCVCVPPRPRVLITSDVI